MKIPVKSEQVAYRIIDKEAVLVLLDRQETVVLNEVGARIWEIIDAKKTLDEIARLISSEFEVTYEEARKDASGFIEDMAAKGAIVAHS